MSVCFMPFFREVMQLSLLKKLCGVALSFVLTGIFTMYVYANSVPTQFENPILKGFSPDPSIVRVNDDYYLTNSSFVWFPGLPIYHSKDLVNWELINHAVSDGTQFNFDQLPDFRGIWAPTIRYHDGLFYITSTCSKCGGNFYITAKDPKGKWSDPVWIKDAPGIDPSLFWNDDGKAYYSGNDWNFKKDWPAQVAVWTQQIDLNNNKFIGERKILTYGHANNARYAESPHIYKINGKYLLMQAEGGTDIYHAISVHHSDNVMGPYVADQINPVLTHRHLGQNYPIKAIGHADLVQTQTGEWWAVLLGMRLLDGEVPLARETFLAKVEFENDTPIFNPGQGKVLIRQSRPDLPWTPVNSGDIRDEFNTRELGINWHFIRAPRASGRGRFYRIDQGKLVLGLQPQTLDNHMSSALVLQKIRDHHFQAKTLVTFSTDQPNEQAGLAIYRNSESYFMFTKGNNELLLTRKYHGQKEVVARIPYAADKVYLKARASGLDLQFSYGGSEESMVTLDTVFNLKVISDSKINKFNGAGIGLYASSNNQLSQNTAQFDWFEYTQIPAKTLTD